MAFLSPKNPGHSAKKGKIRIKGLNFREIIQNASDYFVHFSVDNPVFKKYNVYMILNFL